VTPPPPPPTHDHHDTPHNAAIVHDIETYRYSAALQSAPNEDVE